MRIFEKRKSSTSEIRYYYWTTWPPGCDHTPDAPFLIRLRELHRRAKTRRVIKVAKIYVKDLELMIWFLDRAKEGVNLMLLAYRKTPHIYRSNSYSMGL